MKTGAPTAAFELLTEALQMAREHEENYHEAETLRQLGQVSLQMVDRDLDQAEGFLREALLLAEVQEKLTFALRSAMNLAEFLADHGSLEEAIFLLESKITLFTEGFETHDFITAQRTLQTLNQLHQARKKIA
jgi:predicted ATPase